MRKAAETAMQPGKVKLLDQVRQRTRTLHLSIRTEEAYVSWIQRYLRYHRDRLGVWRHPADMGSSEVNQFLTSLAVQRKVAASTQNQALSAILFLYREILGKDDLLLDAVRAQRPKRLPVVLSVDEVRRVLDFVPEGTWSTMAGLMYGAGMRLLEVCRLRMCLRSLLFCSVVVDTLRCLRSSVRWRRGAQAITAEHCLASQCFRRIRSRDRICGGSLCMRRLLNATELLSRRITCPLSLLQMFCPVVATCFVRRRVL